MLPANSSTVRVLVDNNISADEVTFVDSDDNGKIDTAILTTVDAAKVTYISSDEIVAGGTTYKYADEKIASDVEKNDYVVIRQDLYNDCKNITRADKLHRREGYRHQAESCPVPDRRQLVCRRHEGGYEQRQVR